MKLIDKSALVAEITKRAKEGEIAGRDFPSSAIFGLTQAYKNVLSFIDTLEVKEVDLEKEIKRFTMSKELCEADSVIKAVAEHFFELGLKAQKGEREMATIKSYTDIEQSKKLAEILPIESAENLIVSIGYNDGVKTVTMPKATLDIIKTPFSDIRKTIPCWSLSALLNVLPVSCDDGQHCLALINHNPNDKTEWLCAYEDDKGNLMMECYADNQIDACVAMIEKLHEQNLL